MNPQELSIELPAPGARRATGEGRKKGWQQPQRFSARQKTAVVLRRLRGEPLALLARARGIPAARLTPWREAFLAAGPAAWNKPPLASPARALARGRQTLGEATMAMARWHAKRGRLATPHPVRPRRSRRCARPPRPPQTSRMAWRGSAVCGAWRARPSTGSGTSARGLPPAGGPLAPARMPHGWRICGASWRPRPSPAPGIARGGPGGGIVVAARRRAGSCACCGPPRCWPPRGRGLRMDRKPRRGRSSLHRSIRGGGPRCRRRARARRGRWPSLSRWSMTRRSVGVSTRPSRGAGVKPWSPSAQGEAQTVGLWGRPSPRAWHSVMRMAGNRGRRCFRRHGRLWGSPARPPLSAHLQATAVRHAASGP
jgi:hypothetical protein